MTATVLHFGPDDCKRVLVLRSVGYSVDLCLSISEFRSVIQQRADADAVLVTERPGRKRQEVVTLTREYSHAGLVLFDSSYDGAVEGEFDFVVPPQMPPEDWLQKIADVIERSWALKVQSTAIREQSAQLKKDSEMVRLQSMLERQKSATARARAEGLIEDIRKKADSREEG
ncbi:MAG: hypothetical protein JO300_01170 [Silvibacterium sp.]|nr:hypothetical protein [Silvibacterium sp.]MBV8438700.1 hypothetical protein [Silvibacterium sp.]